jgi:hypothetical protein
MAGMGKHGQDDTARAAVADGPPPKHRDHFWVVGIIAACALAEMFGSWLTVASISGFPHYGPVTTGWVLFVTTEVFWGYALWTWLAGAPGPRSRRFARTSAVVMFVISFAGQEASHLVSSALHAAPVIVVLFVSPLPLVAVGLIAVLFHLRQEDHAAAVAAWRKLRAAEAAAAIERAEADERAWLRRELDALSAQRDADVSALGAKLDEAASALASARQEAAEALRRAEALDRKLAAVSDRKPPRPRKAAAEGARESAQPAAADGDLTTELLAYMALRENPELRKPRKGGDLAREVGVSGATARRYRDKYLNPDGSLKELPAESLTGSLSERTG